MQKIVDKFEAPAPEQYKAKKYAEERLEYFKHERDRAKWRYETAVQSFKNATPREPWHVDNVSKAKQELQFYDDVVAMLKAEMEKQEAKT